MDTVLDTVCAVLSDDEILFTYGDAQSIRGLLESCDNARNAALEEAAKRCESKPVMHEPTAKECAKAIRALKT